MKTEQAIELLEKLDDRFSNIHIVIPIPEGPTSNDVEEVVQSIIESGYATYVQTVSYGDQIVVTDKRNGNARPSRNET